MSYTEFPQVLDNHQCKSTGQLEIRRRFVCKNAHWIRVEKFCAPSYNDHN